MIYTNEFLISLIKTIQIEPTDEDIEVWYTASVKIARTIANQLCDYYLPYKNPKTAAHDVVSNLWIKLFLEGYEVKSNYKAVIYNNLRNYYGWTKKSDRDIPWSHLTDRDLENLGELEDEIDELEDELYD